MPRATKTTDATAEAGEGFAALEAKVEEVQLDVAIEAELAIEDAAAAAPMAMIEQVVEAAAPVETPAPVATTVPPLSSYAALTASSSAPLQNVLSALAACAEGGMRLQTETLASLSQARSPGDLLAAQMQYGRQVLQLYTSNVTRVTQAMMPAAR